MFIENKYHKIYHELIKKRQLVPLDKDIEYCESHHILPKSLGGSDEKYNLVLLTPKEHWIAHRLLAKFTLGEANIKMNWALHRMANSCVDYLTATQYELFRKQHIEFLKNNHHAHRIPNWNERMRDIGFEQWKNNDDRRKHHSNKMKDTWRRNREKMTKHNKSIAKEAGLKSKDKMCERIEYKDKIYVGWAELKRETGLSKSLYMKYYMNGIDPAPRIGANGPISKQRSIGTP